MVAGNPFGKYAPQISPGRSKNVSSILTFTPPPSTKTKNKPSVQKTHSPDFYPWKPPLGGPDLNAARFVESWPRPWPSGVSVGRNGFGSLLRSKSRASLIGSNHLWGGLVVGCCKKREAPPKIQSPEFLGNKRLKITKKKSNYSDVGPGKLDEIAAR